MRPSKWAQPVVSRKWAIIADLSAAIMRVSGYRILAARSHRAWERACGIDAL